jgi:hypothetical protein
MLYHNFIVHFSCYLLQSRHVDSIKLGKGQQDQIQGKQIKGTIDIKEEKEKEMSK